MTSHVRSVSCRAVVHARPSDAASDASYARIYPQNIHTAANHVDESAASRVFVDLIAERNPDNGGVKPAAIEVPS